MFKHDTAVYVGAGLDFIPVFKFREIRTFIYADCMPKYSCDTEFSDELSRPEFPMDLYHTMQRLGFRKVTSTVIEPDLAIYVNPKNGTTIKYYTNLRFPRDADTKHRSFLKEINEASVLICCGHNTDQLIINYMRQGPKVFIGDSETVYRDDPLVDAMMAENQLFETYYKIIIPNFWRHLTVDCSDFVRIQVLKHYSFKEFCRSNSI